jgi:hypothetical protein
MVSLPDSLQTLESLFVALELSLLALDLDINGEVASS